MGEIFFIRHGKASFGSDNYDKLSASGLEQSKFTASFLSFSGHVFDAVYTGTLARHIETAGALYDLYENKGIKAPQRFSSPLFDEYNSKRIISGLIPVLLKINPSMKTYTDRLLQDHDSFNRVFCAVMDMWSSGVYDEEAGSRWTDFNVQIKSGLEEIISAQGSGKKTAVFTSGGVIASVMKQVLGLDDPAAMKVRDVIANASVSRFKYSGGNISLVSFNGICHLETERGNSVTYR